MKVLWVKTNLLHPLNSGGTIRSYNMLRHLKREHEIAYVTLQAGESNGAADLAREYSDRLIEVPWEGAPRRTEWRFYVQAVENLRSTMPLALQRYHVPRLREVLRELTAGHKFDVAVSDFLFPALHFDAIAGLPKVLFQHNVESLIWDRMAKRSKGLSRRYFQSQAKRMETWERRLAQPFDQVVTVSVDDAELMRERFGIEKVATVPTGVDTAFFSPAGPSTERRDVVFVGSLDWLPNIDAVNWLLKDIWPAVRERCPASKLNIVGRRPNRGLRKSVANTSGACLWADVPDVRTYLREAAVVLVPLRVGGGTRLKIFEALACGAPTVSTTVGAEGLPVISGTHLLVASGADGLVDATVSLLMDKARGRELGRLGRELVEREYGWERAASEFAEVCAQTAADYGRRP